MPQSSSISDKGKDLEGLLTDWALGALSAQGHARLREYLPLDEQGRKLARQIEQTVKLARQALSPQPDISPDALPPLLAGRARMSRPSAGLRRIARYLLPLAACLLIGLTLWVLFSSQPAVAEMGPIEVIPQSIELTVFSEPKQQPRSRRYRAQQRAQVGRRQASVQPAMTDRGPRAGLSIGLVRDHRQILNLRKGDNIVRFTNVSAGIIPTSVRFASDTDPDGTKVIEQNFEFDLASADALLNRYIDKRISCLGKDGRLEEGFLASFDSQTIVLSENAGSGQTRSLVRANLTAIRLDELPDGLVTRPTLVWKLRAKTPGRHQTTLSYLTNDIVWRADYIVRLTPAVIPAKAGIHLSSSGHNAASGSAELFTDTNLLDLTGWVTITNQSGARYPDAKLKLIAGDVHTVVEQQEQFLELNYEWFDGGGGHDFRRAERKEFKEKAFFEYHLYTLSAPSTVNDNQIKQLNLLAKRGIQARRVYYYPAWHGNQKVDVQLRFKNDKEHNLGMPLPKGKLRFLQADADGELHQIGEDSIDHTPKDEELELTIGQAFDVVAHREQTSQRRPSRRVMIQDIEITLRNHKNTPIKAVVEDKLNARSDANWRITANSDEFVKEDFQTVSFTFDLPANSEKVITYTVRYDW